MLLFIVYLNAPFNKDFASDEKIADHRNIGV